MLLSIVAQEKQLHYAENAGVRMSKIENGKFLLLLLLSSFCCCYRLFAIFVSDYLLKSCLFTSAIM